MAIVSPSASQVAVAKSHWQDCRLCPFLCGDQRRAGAGRCHIGASTYIASEMLHLGEELRLRPAHAIFFSGCTATCHFCTAARFAFHPTYGVQVSAEQLADRVRLRQREGARSLCFIGGEPTPHIPFILETLGCLGSDRQIPAIFNSNFYLTSEALDLLAGAIDIYLPDLKFGNDECGDTIGGMPAYWSTVTAAIDRVWREGREVLVRHLLMPGHGTCCTEPVLRWLAGKKGIQVSLLTQYLPPRQIGGPLASTLLPEDILAAQALARHLGLVLVE